MRLISAPWSDRKGVLWLSIDIGGKEPYRLVFHFDPFDAVKESRQDYETRRRVWMRSVGREARLLADAEQKHLAIVATVDVSADIAPAFEG